jgi:putative chitinase
MRAIDIVRLVAPRAKPNYIGAFENGDGLLAEHGITTPLRLAHFLAQVMYETGGLIKEEEYGNYSKERLLTLFAGRRHHVTWEEAAAIEHKPELIFERLYGIGGGSNNPRILARELGNTEAGDGYRYRGRGILQTTGRGNYRRMSEKCGVDFEANPDLVLSPEHALKPALAEWTEDKLNAAADRNDIIAITRKINGPGMNGLAERRQWLKKIKEAIR